MENALPTFSVSDFLASINQTFEYAYPSIAIEGEVASFKINQSKYVFFDLKDETGTVGCFMTIWQLRMPIDDGMKVVVMAAPKVTPWGKFSLTVQSIRPSGEGSLKKSFELLKQKLEKEGLFSEQRKRPLPAMPTHIGVISSTQAAGYADFIKILDDRWGGIRIDVAHVQVQGGEAADQIIGAVRYFNEQESLPEVLVILRGGGSADDLSVFNDELLVREIALSRIPTLTGIGHETDESLADLVADKRAATPSNAAQLLVLDKRELIAGTRHALAQIISHTEYALDGQRARITELIDNSGEAVLRKLDDHIAKIGHMHRLITSLDPACVLARGYALVRGQEKVGATITVEKQDVIIKAEVTHVEKRKR